MYDMSVQWNWYFEGLSHFQPIYNTCYHPNAFCCCRSVYSQFLVMVIEKGDVALCIRVIAKQKIYCRASVNNFQQNIFFINLLGNNSPITLLSERHLLLRLDTESSSVDPFSDLTLDTFCVIVTTCVTFHYKSWNFRPFRTYRLN